MSFAEENQYRVLVESMQTETGLLLYKVSGFLKDRNIPAYIVGGFVRDVLLGRDTADIDIAVASDAPEVASALADSLGGKSILLDDVNRVARWILPEEAFAGIHPEIDFSSFTGNIEQDLSRRDFTIDAMAVDFAGFGGGDFGRQIIDPYHGSEDLGNGVVRAVSDSVFTGDAVRLLRAVRLSAELGFTIDKHTEDLIREHSHLISDVAGERVREEFLRLLDIPDAGKSMAYLDELNLLTAIFPELEESRGVTQPKEHHWDVLEHSIATVSAAEYLLGEGEWKYAGSEAGDAVPRSEALDGHFGQKVGNRSSRKSLLKLASLLHDVGKPGTRSTDGDGRIRFLGHGKEGAATVSRMLERLRFSGREIKLVETEVNHHMRPTQMSQEGLPTDRAIYRYFRDTGETGIDILFLSLADHLATRGPGLDITGWREHTQLVRYVLDKHFDRENIINTPKLVDGYDIMKSFGLSPGAEIGKLLEAVREAQAAGEVSSREEALSLVGELISSRETQQEGQG